LEWDLPVLFSPLHAGASGRGLGVGVRTREERGAAAPPGGCAGAGDRGQGARRAAGGRGRADGRLSETDVGDVP